VTAGQIVDATEAGRAMLTAADAPAQRAAMDAARHKVSVTILDLPNYTLSNKTLHPSCVYLDTAFFGYHYWLAHTPYPGSVPLEYPVVCASNDGINWEVPLGTNNPITQASFTGVGSGGYGHAADTHLIEIPGSPRKLRCYWIVSDDTTKNGLIAAETSDGITWTRLGVAGDGFLFEVAGINLASPSVVLDDGTYYLFANRDDEGMTRWTSEDGLTWENETSLTLPSGADLWHSDVKKKGSTWHMLGLKQSSGTDPDLNGLIHLTSADGLVFTGSIAFIHDPASAEPRAFAGMSYYRSSMLPREDGLWDILLSSLIGSGRGDGNTDGAVTHESAMISYARGVDLDKVNAWDWRASTDKRLIFQKLGEPLVDTVSQRTESVRLFAAQKGWHFKYATGVTGLASGVSERVTLGRKPSFVFNSNLGLARAAGVMDISGNLTSGGGECARLVSGHISQATKSMHTTADKFYWGGPREFIVRSQLLAGTSAFTPVAVEDDVITIHGAADVLLLTARCHFMNPLTSGGNIYQEFYLKDLAGTAAVAVGNTLKINGVNLTHNSSNVTLSAVLYPYTTGAINLLYHSYHAGANDGGFVEIFNNSASAWHGRLEYISSR